MKTVILFSNLLFGNALAIHVPKHYQWAAEQNNVSAQMLYALALSETGIENNYGHYIAWPWSVKVDGHFYQYKSRNELFAYLVKHLNSSKKITFGLAGFNLSSFQTSADVWRATDVSSNLLHIGQFIAYKQCKSFYRCVASFKVSKKASIKRKWREPKMIDSLKPNKAMPRFVEAIVIKASKQTGIKPALIAAVIAQESQFKIYAKSHAGAMGLMQLMPNTARYLGLKKADFYDPEKNILAGAEYLREQLENFDGNVSYALAAYNAGPGAVRKYNGIPPYRETKKYVPRVLAYYRYYSEVMG